MRPKRRVLLSKIGLDGHDVGVKFVANLLRNAGYEVIYMGLYQTPEDIVEAAVQEDVALVGISCLSGEYRQYVPRLQELMREEGLTVVPIMLGGLVLPEDVEWLASSGVLVFTAQNTQEEILAGVASTLAGVAGGR